MKKIIALALALIMALCLCSCAEPENPDTTDTTDTTNTTDATNTTDPAENNNNSGETTEKEEKITVSLLNKVVSQDIYGDEIVTTEKIPEYDDDYHLIGIKTYLDGNLYSETTYDKDPSRPLVVQLVEPEYTEDGVQYRTEYTYDENGNELTCTEYDGDGEIIWQYVNTYDADGKIMTEAGPYRERRYTYDEYGNNVRIEEYYNGEWDCSWGYIYDGDGTLTASNYNSNGSWSTSTYDACGNILKTVSGSGDEWTGDEITTCYENTYDHDRLVEVKVYLDGVLTEHRQYDSNGNETLSVSYYSDGTEESRVEYTYDENGNLIDISSYYDDELDSKSTLTYETVTVSNEQAEKIEKITATLDLS